MKRVVVDTNVALTANGKASHADDSCMEACIDFLLELRELGVVIVDDQGLILGEYQRRLSFAGQPGVGDAFFRWLWNNQANPRHCRQVSVSPTDAHGTDFAEFPKDPALSGFDRADRKFVAVALAGKERPTIANATDSDWWNYREALERHGVKIQFLCSGLAKGGRVRKR